ncbi:APC family permease [Citricoccus sp.]|uniref:APC family permease n=1 Tax=Citricoccus sp. TaxID=1978372 RepID=UPI002CF7C7AB|nr:APC family permease [Citricoccus sp.]HRO95279.1 APC family permease [Citricoccus sp.]
MTSVTGPPSLLPARTPVRMTKVLGVVGLTVFGIAYMVPLTVFSTLGPVAEITGNGVPGAYVVTLVCMLFTALSYGKMTRRYPVAGSAYTYSQQAFGGHAGFLTGWALMLDYLLLPMINYLLIGLYMGAYLPGVPTAVWVLAAIALVTVLNVLGIKSVSTFNGIVVVVQVVFAVSFVLLSLGSLSGGSVPDPSVAFSGMNGVGALFTGAAILCLSFLGFDAVSTLSEEARHPQRDVPRAIMAVTLIGGLTFIGLSFVSYLVVPDWQSFQNVDTASAEVVQAAGGAWLSNFFAACLLAGATGSALASQASVSRILYTMGRDGVLPRRLFGVLTRRFNSPARATLVVSLVSLSALVLPLEIVITIISFGALAAFTMVNLSVVKTYAIDDARRRGRDAVSYIVLPLIGFALTLWLWTSLPGSALLVGGVWLLVGLAYLAVLTRGFRRQPPVLDLKEDL